MKPYCYNFYATLLDGYQGYLNSDQIWDRYWGASENPKYSQAEFEQVQFQGLIDKINRVPIDSEAADRGTCFNEVVDCIVNKRAPQDKFLIKSDKELNTINVKYKNRVFVFNIDDCKKAAQRYEGSIEQVFTEALLPTKYGNVRLYGYIDELLPDYVVDIKTTGRAPSAFSFRDHWQHRVYPYCLSSEGVYVYTFIYDIYVLNDSNKVTGFYQEHYTYVPERDIPDLTSICEGFIDFLHRHKDLITDKKIFND